MNTSEFTPIEEVSKAEELAVRAATEEFVQSSRHADVVHAHVSNGNPACGEPGFSDSPTVKNWNILPVGHKQICKKCVEVWRQGDLYE